MVNKINGLLGITAKAGKVLSGTDLVLEEMSKKNFEELFGFLNIHTHLAAAVQLAQNYHILSDDQKQHFLGLQQYT